jgi:hypothetical protein
MVIAPAPAIRRRTGMFRVAGIVYRRTVAARLVRALLPAR